MLVVAAVVCIRDHRNLLLHVAVAVVGQAVRLAWQGLQVQVGVAADRERLMVVKEVLAS